MLYVDGSCAVKVMLRLNFREARARVAATNLYALGARHVACIRRTSGPCAPSVPSATELAVDVVVMKDAGVAGVFGVLGRYEPLFVVEVQRRRGLPSKREASEGFVDNDPVLLRPSRPNSVRIEVPVFCCDPERTNALIELRLAPQATTSGEAGL